MGPAPMTTTRSPPASRARRTACTATASGSTVAPASSLTSGGSAWQPYSGART